MPYADPAVQRAYQLAWIMRRRTEWIDANGPCRQCGSSESLEVDHIDPKTKSIQPAGIWSLSAARREAELAKCQVLCGPCHRAKSDAQLRLAGVPHGTHTGYSRHGCRCAECRAGHAQYERERRRAKA